MKRHTMMSGLAAGALLSAARPVAAQTPALPVLRVGAIPVDISAQVYYAKEMGFFRKAGIDVDVTPMANGGSPASAAIAGALEAGFSGIMEVMAAREKGIKLAILAPANTHVSSAPTAGIVGVLATSPFQTAKDLTGRTVACNPLRGSTWLGCKEFIDKAGGDSTKTSFVEMPLQTMSEAVKAGRVDAALFDALGANTIGKPGDPLRLLGNAFDAIAHEFTPSVWVCSGDWLAKNPDLGRKFAIAMRETSIWANAHHDESAEILAKYTKFTVPQLKGLTRVTYGVDLTPQLTQPLIDAAAKYGIIAKAFPARELIATIPPH